jgi:hypothetical protein
VQDHPEPFGALRLFRQLEPPPGLPDALLGPADALGDRRLRGQERRRDLGGGQAAGGPQGERELR